MTRLALCALAALSLTACFHIRYVQQEPAEPTPAYESWNSTYLFGLIEGGPVHDASRACPGGFAEARNVQSFVNGLVQMITFTIYAPTEVSIHCAPKRAAAAEGAPGTPVALAR